MFPTVDAEDISRVTLSSRNSSPSSDVRDSTERSESPKHSINKEYTANMLIKELVFCVALVVTTYGAMLHSPTKISKHPQAVRFFGPQSVVMDWYRGQLSHALNYINNADISFVMYYAPWDAESQHVRDEFDRAASVLSGRVHFSAINCWNPGSECRLQHNKIPSWPILIVYTVNSKAVLYKGPRDAHNMVKFVELIMKPLDRVTSTEDLVHLLSVCEAVAVGYTPLSETSKYYNVWYQVALKSKEFDVIGEICFAVVTSEDLAVELGVDSMPSARLMMWNATKEYRPGEEEQKTWNESSLITWVLDNFTQPVARIIPQWKKSFAFEPFVDGSPMLMLFTPLNPLYEQLPSYDLLREVAMEYYNCKNNQSNPWTNELMKLQHVQRLLYEQKDIDKFCQNYNYRKMPVRKSSKYLKKEVVSHNNKYPWSNTTQKNQKNGFFNFLVKRGLAISKIVQSSEDVSEMLASLGLLQCSTMLPAEKSFYENPQSCQHQFDENIEMEPDIRGHWGDSETSMLPVEEDPLSPAYLVQDNVRHFCRLMRFAKQFSPVITPESTGVNNITHIHGLACAKNFSLNMLAVDSVQNHHFAEALGIDITNKKDKTAVVILDVKHESQYVLSEPYSAKSVRDFIYNFTHKSVKRSLRTHVADASHTHYFGSEGQTDQMGVSDKSIHIVDLTTRSFRRVVRTPGQVTIVVVCGGTCGPHAPRAVMAATRLLQSCGVRAMAARIDARRHDLPWHYTVHTYPTVLVFAASRDRGVEPDSRALPPTARVSAAGVLALALRSLPLPAHLRLRLALCARSESKIEKKTCLQELREHVTILLGRNLKYWRRSEGKRLKDALLKRLQYLHQVSLNLSLLHVTDLTETSQKLAYLQNSLSILSENWDIDIPALTSKKTNITVPQLR